MPSRLTWCTDRLIEEDDVDALSALLAPRARGAFVVRTDVAGPWAVRVADQAPLTLVVVVEGRAVLDHDGAPRELRTGGVALVRGPRPYTVGDGVQAPQAVIGPGQVCTRPDGSPLGEFRDLGLLAWGNLAPGQEPTTVLLTATYQDVHQVSRGVLAHLPEVVVLEPEADGARTAAVVDLLLAETRTTAAAHDVVVDRLVDLVLVTGLRAWFDRAADRPPWWDADADDVVGPALRRIHHEPHRPWTLASLAADVGVSRATLARRFSSLVGEPPMGYLARWRLDLASDLVAAGDLPLAAVAARVGYASAYSLSGAFRRARGHSPSHLRVPRAPEPPKR